MRLSQPFVLCSLLALGVLACGSSNPDDSGGGLPQDKDSFGSKPKLSDSDLSGWKQATVDGAYSLWTAGDLTGNSVEPLVGVNLGRARARPATRSSHGSYLTKHVTAAPAPRWFVQ